MSLPSYLRLTPLFILWSCSAALHAESSVESGWRTEILESSRLRQKGDYARAESRLERLIAQLRRLKPQSHAMAAALNGLAIVHADRGDFAVAEQMLRRAQRIWETNGDRRSLNQCVSNLVSVYLESGNQDEAETLLRNYLAAPETEGDPAKAGLMHHLAALYFEQHKYEEALPLATQAIELCRQRSGPQNAALGPMLNTLALLNAKLGRTEAALDCFKQSLDMMNNASPVVVTKVLLNLATLHAQIHQFGEADLEFSQARKTVEESLGNEHPLMPMVLENHAAVLRKLGRKSEAKEAIKLAASLRRSHPASSTRSNIVDVSELADR